MEETLELKEDSMMKEEINEIVKPIPILQHVQQVKDVPIIDLMFPLERRMFYCHHGFNGQQKEEPLHSRFLSYVKVAIQKARNCATSTFQNLRSIFL